jgi:hypothetical protein
VRALHLNGLDLLGLDFDVLALGHLVAASFVLLINHAPGLFIDHLLTQAVAGLPIDLMEVRSRPG